MTVDDKSTASNDILPSLEQARTNLQSVKHEKNAILFLSRWSNPRSIIEKKGLIQKEREADDKGSVIGSDITHQLLDPFIRENQQAIFHLKDLLQRLPLSIEQIDNQVSPVDPVKLPRMNDRDIDSTTEKVELLWNFAIKLKNELIKANQDLKHKIDSVVKWTTQETQEREKERKDHVKSLNEKDKIIQRYEVLAKVKDDDKRGLVSGPSGSKTSKLQQQIFDLQKIMAQNNEQYKKVCMERDDLRNRLKSVQRISHLENQIDQLRGLGTEKDDIIKSINHEKEELQTRLSSIAGEKLTKGNPSITDLGDPNRPMKISEMYGELYDNEWTDCMECTDVIKPQFEALEHSELEEIEYTSFVQTVVGKGRSKCTGMQRSSFFQKTEWRGICTSIDIETETMWKCYEGMGILQQK
ncbi:Hypothetical predicted protein [Mytilus galloprovincialis]|uniref:Uncharacterized protein n=1 Tax=Mytilus galloprovincialis TaxID=29158 RepID=A0A8B6BRJ2_MYTGA|nr:Hypothetical predicted protein [Mytilus galloprovincialis]